MAEQWWMLRFDKIEPVQIEKFTDKSVWVSGRRFERAGWLMFFKTWEECHACMLSDAEAEVRSLRLRLEQANGHLGNVKGMKPPTREVSP